MTDTVAQRRLDELLGAFNRLINASYPGSFMYAAPIREWQRFRATVQRIAAEVGADIVRDQERRQSES